MAVRGASSAVLAVVLAVAGCTSAERPDARSTQSPPVVPDDFRRPPPAGQSSVPPEPQPDPDPAARPVRPADLRVGVATRTVAHLAGVIGPRHATSPAFRRAARWVSGELRATGLDVRRQAVAVPGGDSWGVPVTAGTSYNVIATPRGFEATDPHLVLGAHLDTVPQAPGAEDNASGVGVLLAVARALEEHSARLPVVLVAFGAEEPRGPTDDDHHYGSRAYVASLGPAERPAVRGMLSLDRVGVGAVVPVCTAGDEAARGEALRAGRRAGVATLACDNRSSDHWSFVRQGLPGARIGGTSYAGYHSAGDVPAVVSRAQLERTGRLVLAWLAGPPSR